jgi:D-glycerate 3-kinase
MSDLQVERFILHYERLTRHILEEMPGRADLVLDLDTDRSVRNVRENDRRQAVMPA